MPNKINRNRIRRLAQTFNEVHAETGSLSRAVVHTVRFASRKLVPLASYIVWTFARIFLSRRLRRINGNRGRSIPVLGIRILGGMGDYIVIARFLRDLCAGIEPSEFDLYSNKPKLASWIFAKLPGFRGSYGDSIFGPADAGYTVAMQISQFVQIEDDWVVLDKIKPFPRLCRAVEAIRAFRPGIEQMIEQHPRLDSMLAQKAIFANRSRRDYLHHMAGIDYAGDRMALAIEDSVKRNRGLDQQPYVTVHNGYDPNMVVSRATATKCYPHFGAVISLLRLKYPGVVFVQVGIHTSVAIPEADIDLIGHTSWQQAAGLIRDALFHLDNESGLVHLARALDTPCCVVFGPTSSRYFGYPANINVDPAFCGGCWWVAETWMNHCPRGFSTARCMTEQPAAVVAKAAEGFRLPIAAAPHTMQPAAFARWRH